MGVESLFNSSSPLSEPITLETIVKAVRDSSAEQVFTLMVTEDNETVKKKKSLNKSHDALAFFFLAG